MKRLLLSLLFISCLHNCLIARTRAIDYVNPFIGTSNSRWMLGPYAQRPFGMVQLGPDNQGNRWMGGYEYAINSVSGFSHIHAWTMGGLMMMPTTADLALTNPSVDSPYKGANAGYHSRILKESEKASPGYYEVMLYDHNVKVEITTTERCGFQRYTFPKSKEARVLIDLLFPTEWDYGFTVNDAKITKVSDTELEGYADCKSGSWSSWNEWKLHFVIRFSRPFESVNSWNEGDVKNNISEVSGSGDIGVYVTYNTNEGDQVMVQSGLSLVDIEGARRNLDSELSSYAWDFNSCVDASANIWNDLLSKIEVTTSSEEDKVKFYTNLYRSYTGKQIWNDVDGRYRDACENVQVADKSKAMYGGDAFWNSYWNLNGLWSIITPRIIDNWVTTQLEMFDKTGYTSKGPAGIEYSDIMEGSHEIALMVAACQKGIRKDKEQVYNAVHKMVTVNGGAHEGGGGYGQRNLDVYTRKGYMPSEYGVVSKTLDYAYDDYCVSQMARLVGKKRDAEYFYNRSMNYKNVFNPDTKYVTRRDSLGNWDPDFDVFSNKGFIEGNSWQYSWYVPHDTEGLIDIIGKDLALKRLEDGFEKSREHKFAAHVFDRTAGQSAEFYINQGNEVNMSSSFIFNYLGKPNLCQKYTTEILNSFYGSSPYHGWEGDEDEGQMSSWFVMSSIGLFEMNGGVSLSPRLELTSPLFDKVVIHLDNDYYEGKTFMIEARGRSDKHIYIKRIYLNGKELSGTSIAFSDIINGGELLYIMGE